MTLKLNYLPSEVLRFPYKINNKLKMKSANHYFKNLNYNLKNWCICKEEINNKNDQYA